MPFPKIPGLAWAWEQERASGLALERMRGLVPAWASAPGLALERASGLERAQGLASAPGRDWRLV